jgi:hypothetical protein
VCRRASQFYTIGLDTRQLKDKKGKTNYPEENVELNSTTITILNHELTIVTGSRNLPVEGVKALRGGVVIHCLHLFKNAETANTTMRSVRN